MRQYEVMRILRIERHACGISSGSQGTPIFYDTANEIPHGHYGGTFFVPDAELGDGDIFEITVRRLTKGTKRFPKNPWLKK